jgi:polyphosphate kinase 2 (PPK2 family)
VVQTDTSPPVPGIRLADLDMPRIRKRKQWYRRRVEDLQLQMLRLQRAYHRQGLRGVLVFEGWDASGKGGCIRRLVERLDPRGFNVHAIGAPSQVELGRHHLRRFWQRLPHPGGLAIFDRSWYGRVLVERVEEFTPEPDWRRGYREINEFERTLVDDGVRLAKVFLHISDAEQLERFGERLRNPYKRWKLTVDDFRNRSKRDAYEAAIEEMFNRTSTDLAPWHVIGADFKWHARVRVLEVALEALGEGVDTGTPLADPDVVRIAREHGLSPGGSAQDAVD